MPVEPMNPPNGRFESSTRFELALLLSCAFVGWLVLLVLFGLWPGLSPAAGMQQFFLGLARCYAENLPGLECNSVAYPGGYTTAFGLPYVLPVAMLDRIGVPLFVAGRLVELAYLGIALGAAFLLYRLLGIRRWIALALAFVFLASPIVFAQDGYGPLRTGFALVPLYALVDLVVVRRILARSNRKDLVRALLLGFVAVLGVRLFALFMDGYSFVMGLALSGALVLVVMLQQAGSRPWRSLVGAALVFGLPTVIAYLAYGAYAGDAVERAVMPLDFFRGQGVDFYALAVPSSMFWWAELLSLHHSVNWWMSFSDGPSVSMVYLGWVTIAAVLIGLLGLLSRPFRADASPYLGILVLVLAGAMLLAAGPSLKIADFRQEPPPGRGIQFSDYLMPESAATLSLGTAVLYEKVPGIRNMRAVYRWMLLVKLSALLIAGLVLEQLLQRRSARPLVVMLLGFLILESLPDVSQRFAHGQRHFDQFQRFQNEALRSLQALELNDQRVLMIPVEDDPEWNHFTANFLCPLADLRCFNLGGDKSMVRARLTWPVEIRELARNRWTRGNLERVLDLEHADAVLIPLFSLRGASYHWPPSDNEVERYLERAHALAASVGARGSREGWFVRLVRDAPAFAGTVEGDGAPTAIEVDRWGPKRGSFEAGFNIQVDGRSSFWVTFAEGASPRESMLLSLDGLALETFNDATILSARLVDPADRERFPPGMYPLRLHDRESGAVIDLGQFEVIQSP